MTPTTNLAAHLAPLLLAESTFQGVASSGLGELLVGLAALLVIAKIMWDAADRLRGGTAQKREVSFADQFATTAQHAELRGEVAKIDHERRTSVANLHDKIDTLAANLHERIDAVPERTIALLRETKQLHQR